MAAIRLIISGRVQGVGFRFWARREAQRRGLRGWVRNRRDGTVETLLIGNDAGLADMVVACARGPSLAVVRSIERHAATDDGGTGFRELATE